MNTVKTYSILLIILLLSSTTCVYATSKDTIKVRKDSMNVRYFYESSADSSGNILYHHIDTSLNEFQKYNPIYENMQFFETSSNIGLANKNLLFTIDNSCGFDYGRHSSDGYLYKYDHVKYYHLEAPYTDLFYVMGAKREQVFRIIHSQNISKYWNVGADFRLIYSTGTYKRQKADNQNLVLFTDFSTKNQRYHILSNFIHNRIKNQENGGISSDSLFENGSIKPLETGINLLGAENRIRESSCYLKQYYTLGFHRSNVNDTIKKKEFISLGRIAHSFLYKRQSLIYDDAYPTLGFYANVFSDTLLTHDSTSFYQIENTIAYLPCEINNNNNSFGIRISAGVKHQYTELAPDTVRRYFNQFIPQARITLFAGKHILVHGDGEYVKGDYNDGDYCFSATAQYKLLGDSLNGGMIELKGSSFAKEPSWMFTHYYSNHFIWDYSLEKVKGQYAGISYRYKKLGAGADYYLLNNYVYFDFYARPKQSSENAEVLCVYLCKNFVVGDWALDNRIVYQKVYGASIIRLPELMSKHSLYYNYAFFKKALIGQIGLDVLFSTKYYADAYMPALGQFYIQQEKQTGDYPFADLYINAKIKRAIIFVKLQHVNAGLMDKTYYEIPHYPMQGRAIKFGVTWKFYN